MHFLAALAAEFDGITALMESLDDGDWGRPTRCAPMTVHDLCGHLLRQPRNMIEYPRRADLAPEKDAVSYYRYDPAAVSAAVLARAQEVSRSLDPPALMAEWRRLTADALESARDAWEENPTVETPLGSLSLREYVRSRCVEATVHHMDLLHALSRPERPSPEGLAVVVGILEGMLGAPRADTGYDEIAFVLTGTGRCAPTEDERDRLGPLAERFPLLR